MSIRRASFGLVLAALVATTASAAAPRPTSGNAAEARAAADPKLERALREAVAQHVSDAGLAESLKGYSLAASLLQLRRYVDPGQKRTKFVCVVELSVQNAEREVVVQVSGSAAAFDGSAREVIDRAAHSAVLRVPEALADLQARQGNARWARR